MRHRLLALLVLAAAAFAGATTASSAVGDTVSGSGTRCPATLACDFVLLFSFDATITAADGSATGTFSFSSTPSVGGPAIDVLSGHIVCVSVVGNRAALKGVVDSAQATGFHVGDDITWWVQDTGPGGTGDLLSDSTIAPDLPCGDFSEVFAAALTSGDISIVLHSAPGSKDDCKDGGWRSFTSPAFKNQGDCIVSLKES